MNEENTPANPMPEADATTATAPEQAAPEAHSMSVTMKALIVVAVLAVLVGGASVWYANHSMTRTSTGPIVATTPAPMTVSPTSGASTLPTQSDTNKALSQDLSSIDSQLSGLNHDQANVNQSMNYQQAAASNL